MVFYSDLCYIFHVHHSLLSTDECRDLAAHCTRNRPVYTEQSQTCHYLSEKLGAEQFVKLDVPVSSSSSRLLLQIIFVGGSSSQFPCYHFLFLARYRILLHVVYCLISVIMKGLRIAGHRSACSRTDYK